MSVNQIQSTALEALVVEFFRQSEGQWNSQRRYYTLNPNVATQEVESHIQIKFLKKDCVELRELAQLHALSPDISFVCGTYVTWESNYTGKIRKPSTGSTIFGALGNILYRDRGFATADPVCAIYNFSNPQTMTLKTEYSGSVFEEEIKLIGQQYRTRQTIISRAGQEQMIGQYLEKRVGSEN